MAEPKTDSSLRFVHPPREGDVTPLSDADFARIANQSGSGATITDDSPEAAKRNRARAQEDLGHISELRRSRSFSWFYDLCIRRNYQEHRGIVDTTTEELSSRVISVRVAAFQQWRRAARWLIEREIEARRLLDPKDPHLPDLRKELAAI